MDTTRGGDWAAHLHRHSFTPTCCVVVWYQQANHRTLLPFSERKPAATWSLQTLMRSSRAPTRIFISFPRPLEEQPSHERRFDLAWPSHYTASEAMCSVIALRNPQPNSSGTITSEEIAQRQVLSRWRVERPLPAVRWVSR
jgi:hypothetical protein